MTEDNIMTKDDIIAKLLVALERAQTRLYVAQNNGFDIPRDDMAAIAAAIAQATN